ncbi:alpha/beta fold hydrolase [Virgibacillus sp.]|uniref:alpha/beta fold hydrolase n=1 Tax=Virgibacillus sp. TaxID=1872700 RepID=UPI0017E1467D|nr:alpha/beta hydrolase [Virgibacillus sp.]NWO13380.1 lysophospholipase [Virgibacillus sp.]
MKQQTFWYQTDDHTDVFIKKWEPAFPAKGVIQIAHGMMEHIERYHDFATYLTSQGFIVYGNDHRGHGKTGEKQGMLGYFAETDGFYKAVHDLRQVSELIQTSHPSLPVFLFGHSMGSFFVRSYIQSYSNSISGVILSGTGYYPTTKLIAGQRLASLLPPKEKAVWMNKLVFGSFNKKVDYAPTGFEWLTRSTEAIDKYMKDPYTGFIPTGQFFYDLFTGLRSIHNSNNYLQIRCDLPVLLISGDHDPVGNYAKGVWKTAEFYTNCGLTQIVTMLFANGRHELIHEWNKQEVYEVIMQWTKKAIA